METERNHLKKTQLSQAKDLEKLRKQITMLKKQQANQVSFTSVNQSKKQF
jgi:hypothetical protein